MKTSKYIPLLILSLFVLSSLYVACKKNPNANPNGQTHTDSLRNTSYLLGTGIWVFKSESVSPALNGSTTVAADSCLLGTTYSFGAEDLTSNQGQVNISFTSSKCGGKNPPPQYYSLFVNPTVLAFPDGETTSPRVFYVQKLTQDSLVISRKEQGHANTKVYLQEH